MTSPPPAPPSVRSMELFDRLIRIDRRYGPLLQQIGLDEEGMGNMLADLDQSVFDRAGCVEHQLAWLRDILSTMPPVVRRDLTAYRSRGKV